jgi:TatA/E family protein of Tat protein translocase
MFALLIFEFLGTTELLVILVVALVLFGPRKLPQLSRSLGKSLAEFKRASEEFKQTWEREVAMESVEKERETTRAMLPEDNSILGPSVGRESIVPGAAVALPESVETHVADADAHAIDDAHAINHSSARPPAEANAPAPEPTRKRDWL